VVRAKNQNVITGIDNLRLTLLEGKTYSGAEAHDSAFSETKPIVFIALSA
jgi:hypothetical protein